MDAKTKELIAIGASVSAHCQPCVSYHVAKAREFGVGDEQIQEAIAVGQMVEKGASLAMRDFAHGLLAKPAAGLGCSPEKGRFETPAGDARCHCS